MGAAHGPHGWHVPHGVAAHGPAWPHEPHGMQRMGLHGRMDRMGCSAWAMGCSAWAAWVACGA
eukprot:46402-Chlamydomonas_euryale.AAC.1